MNATQPNVLSRVTEVSSERKTDATSWGAVIAGAVAAAALSLILLSLGTGIGLSSISPWSSEGRPPTPLGFGAIIWLLVMSALASGLGGYLAGRLRAKWFEVDADEAFFRDTAHGLLAWAVATVVSAAVLASAASSMVGTVTKTAAGAATALGVAATGGAAAAATNASESSRDYFVDMMFRSEKPVDPSVDMTSFRREASGILSQAATTDLSPGDRAYLSQMVATRTGVSQAQADQRVTETTTAAKLAADAAAAKAKEIAEVARKTGAYTALWLFISLLLGAFSAALAATWGGRQRDRDSYMRLPV